MACQHRFKNPLKKCKNETIGNSQYCYLKSHHGSTQDYEIAKQKVLSNFQFEFEDLNGYTVVDVDGDGACMYRSFAQAVYKRLDSLEMHELYSSICEIVGFDQGEFLDESGETDLAIFLQRIIKDWLFENRNENVKLSDCKIKDLVELTHDLPINIYRMIFEIFAGSPDFLVVEKDGVKSVKQIPCRWGGSPEQYAFTCIFNFTVRIQELITLDRRKLKIKKATLRHKYKRLRTLQTFEADNDEDIINLCYTEIKNIPHYMYLHDYK